MSLKAGQTICNGKYRILDLIGEGSFARVWRAQEFDSKGQRLRAVAIKELKREALSAQELAEQEPRFEIEIRVSTSLLETEVPNVLRVLTSETLVLNDVSAIPLLITEHLPGGNLAGLIAAHPEGMDWQRAVCIALDVAYALEGLHNRGIVHRDVKPSNILFRTVEGSARLADFGTAQLPGETVSGSRTLGTAGYHPGSPDYMPPEQLPPNRDYLSPSADVFALGCVLFEMLTGTPYKRALRKGQQLQGKSPDVPAWLEALVDRALAKDPGERRYEDASAFAAALRAGTCSQVREGAGTATETTQGKTEKGQKLSSGGRIAMQSPLRQDALLSLAALEVLLEMACVAVAMISFTKPSYLWPAGISNSVVLAMGVVAAAIALWMPARRGFAVIRARRSMSARGARCRDTQTHHANCQVFRAQAIGGMAVAVVYLGYFLCSGSSVPAGVESVPAPSPSAFMAPSEMLSGETPAAALVTPAVSGQEEYTLFVGRKVSTHIYVDTGDVVTVWARGSVDFGGWSESFGRIDPDGQEIGVTESNIVRDIPHGTLLCRISGGRWLRCGSGKTWIAESSGYLEFNVNDSQQQDNEGFFEVQLRVARE